MGKLNEGEYLCKAWYDPKGECKGHMEAIKRIIAVVFVSALCMLGQDKA